MFAHQPADAAAQREPRNTRRRNDSTGRRQAVKLSLTIEFAPCCPALRLRHFPLGIHVNALHWREIDHEASVDRGTPGDIVSAAPDRDLEAELTAKLQSIGDIGNTGTAGDQRGSLVDQAVMD